MYINKLRKGLVGKDDQSRDIFASLRTWNNIAGVF